MKRINYEDFVDKHEGFYSVQTLIEQLGLTRRKAIYLIHKLRNKGYVKTSYGEKQRRTYFISRKNKYKTKSYTDRINETSPIQLATWNPHYVYGREITYEEALIYAIKKRDIRHLIASLALFKKIKDWNLLYKMAKKENLILEIVVLYEVSRKVIKKLRKMPKKYYNLAKKEVSHKYRYIINGFYSKNLQDIERKWKVYIPLNYSDLAEYRGFKT